MLVRVCDFCGEQLDADNFIRLDSGFIRSTEKYKNKHDYDFGERDICLPCAKAHDLMKILEKVRVLNV